MQDQVFITPAPYRRINHLKHESASYSPLSIDPSYSAAQVVDPHEDGRDWSLVGRPSWVGSETRNLTCNPFLRGEPSIYFMEPSWLMSDFEVPKIRH